MRRSILTLLASALLILSGCVQNDILEPTLQMQTITVSAGMGTDTKAGVSDSGAFTWHANDAISVLGTDGLYYTLTLTSGAGTKNAEFSGDVPEGVSITTVATYPAIVENGVSSTIYDSESKVLNFTLPAEYTYTEGYANVPMVATFEAGAESLAFKHIGALVRIPLNGMPANSKVYVSTTNRKVTGEFLLATDKVGTAEGVITTVTRTTDNAVTVNYTSEVSGQTAEINLPLPVGTYESLSVSVKNAADEEVFTKTWDLGSLEFKRANILVLEAEQVGPIGVSKVYPFFVDARVFWAKAKDVEKYALYVDGASEPAIVSTDDLTIEENGYSYMIGGQFAHNSTHTVSVAPVINNVPAVELKSDAIEFTTGNVMQITYNTGTKFICAGWDDVAVGPDYGTYFSSGKWNKIIEVAGKSDPSVRGYQIQLYKEDKTTLLYDEIPFDGQESGKSPFISGNYWGRIASASCLYPTSLSLGWLEPDTKYYFRVRTLSEPVAMNSDNGNFKEEITLKSARGGSAWSDFVEMKTDAAYVMSDYDVLYEGFDDMLYNSDIGNMSAAAVPMLLTSKDDVYKERHEGQLSKWLKKDLENREFSEQEVNVFLSPYQLGLTNDSYNDALTPRTFNALAGSLEGWSVLSIKADYDAYPDFGLLRIGQNINSKAGCAEIRTAPIVSDKLSADKEKACFVTIHVSPAQGTYIIPKKKVIISQYRDGEIIEQKTINDYTLNADGTLRQEWVDNYVEESRQDYERTPIWFEVTETFNLINGDMLSISTASVDRGFVMLSDIKITIDKDADYDSDEDETRFYGTAPDNTNYDIWGMNGVMPVTFWMGPPALDQFNADAITAAELANLKATYFDPIVQGGYNLIEISNPYPSSMNVLLQWCADAGVKMIDKSIGDWTNTQANVDRITQYANNTAFAGLFVGRDEPAVSDYSIISQMNAAFKSSLPTKTRTVNLFPDYANSSQLGVSTYENYVSTFVNQIDMSDGKFNFMYDHYCLKKSDKYGNASRGLVNSTQYHNLDIVRHYSLEKRLPFIQITHGRPQWDPGYSATIANNDSRWTTDVSATALPPKPDEHVYDEQRWLVWSQLALGSKGVSYFCYWTPDAFKGGPFSFHVDGTKTRMYDILKNINTEIQPIGKILMTCHADGAMTTSAIGNFVMFENEGSGLHNYGPVLDLIKEGNEDVIAGCFRDASTGEYKLLVTHQAPATNDTEAATASIAKLMIDTTMASEVKLHTVTLTSHNSAASTVVTTADVSSGTLTLSIPDGTAVLVEFPETANVNYN